MAVKLFVDDSININSGREINTSLPPFNFTSILHGYDYQFYTLAVK